MLLTAWHAACRTEQFAAEARSADELVRKLRQEAGELKAALTSSQAECKHLRQQIRARLLFQCPHHAQHSSSFTCTLGCLHVAEVFI